MLAPFTSPNTIRSSSIEESDSEKRDRNEKLLNAVLLLAQADTAHHEDGKYDDEEEDASKNVKSKLLQKRKVLNRAVKTKTLKAQKKRVPKKTTPLPSKDVLQKALRSRKQKDNIDGIDKAEKERKAQKIMKLYPETGDMMKELKEELAERNINHRLFCETILNKNRTTLSQIFKNPAPWSKQRDSRDTYVNIGKWMQLTDEEKLEQIKTSERRQPSKNLCGEDKYLDTVKLMKALHQVLKSLGVSQYKFAKQVLGVKSGVFNTMIGKKRSWDSLKTRHDLYWTCYEWMQKSDKEKMSSIVKKTRLIRRSTRNKSDAPILVHANKVNFEELPEQLKNPEPDLKEMMRTYENSESLLTQLKNELQKHKIGQAVFLREVLGQNSDGVSRLACDLSWRQMMASNRSSNKLESFRKIHNWLNLPEEERMALQADTRKQKKKRPAVDMDTTTTSQPEEEEQVKKLKRTRQKTSNEKTEVSQISAVKSAIITATTEKVDSALEPIQLKPVNDAIVHESDEKGLSRTMQRKKRPAADMDTATTSQPEEEEGVKQLKKPCERISEEVTEVSQISTTNTAVATPPTKKGDSAPTPIQPEPVNNAIVREQANMDRRRKKINIWSLINKSGIDAWLDDPIMNMYLKDLCTKSAQYKQFDAALFTNNGGFDQFIKAKMEEEVAEVYFFPICDGVHWTLLTIFKDHVKYYDPSPFADGFPPLPVANLIFLLDKPLRPYDDKTPFQKDGFNCGVFCLLMAKSTVEGVRLTQEDADEQVKTFRKELEYKLVHSDKYDVTRDKPTRSINKQAKTATDNSSSRTSTTAVQNHTTPAQKNSKPENEKSVKQQRTSEPGTVDDPIVLESDDDNDVMVIEPDDEEPGRERINIFW